MNLPYYMWDDEDLEEKIKVAHEQVEENKHREEEKAEKQWESDLLSGLHLNNSTGGSGSGKSSQSKTPGSKGGVMSKGTPASNKNASSSSGTSFGSSAKAKATPVSKPAASKGGSEPKKRH